MCGCGILDVEAWTWEVSKSEIALFSPDFWANDHDSFIDFIGLNTIGLKGDFRNTTEKFLCLCVTWSLPENFRQFVWSNRDHCAKYVAIGCAAKLLRWTEKFHARQKDTTSAQHPAQVFFGLVQWSDLAIYRRTLVLLNNFFQLVLQYFVGNKLISFLFWTRKKVGANNISYHRRRALPQILIPQSATAPTVPSNPI